MGWQTPPLLCGGERRRAETFRREKLRSFEKQVSPTP